MADFFQSKPLKKSAIIIGGGPAGCQCALWLKMLGHNAVIIEQSAQLGAQKMVSKSYINNWLVGTIGLNGPALAANIHAHIMQMEIPVLFNTTVSSLKINNGIEVMVKNDRIEAPYLVIATGVKPSTGVFFSSEHVLIGPGNRTSTYPFKGKRVAILGGGDNAAANYVSIKEKKARVVHVYARTVKACAHLWNQVSSPDSFVGSYTADQNSMRIEHERRIQQYDVFIVLYGWQANIPVALESLKQQLLNDKLLIEIDHEHRTQIPHVFAAGDATTSLYPCVATAMANGVIVAKVIQQQLDKLTWVCS